MQTQEPTPTAEQADGRFAGSAEMIAGPEERLEWLGRALNYPAIELGPRSLADLECLAAGAYAPLNGFMCRADYESVLKDMRLASGAAWTIPITLPIDDEQRDAIRGASAVVLVSEGSQPLAILHVEEIFDYDRQVEARHVFRTEDPAHPGIVLLSAQGSHLAGGRITLLDLPPGRPFEQERLMPSAVRKRMAGLGWSTACGFHTRFPSHRSHEYVTKCALELVDGLLFHPIAGEARPEDIPDDARVAGYGALLSNFYPASRVIFSIFPGVTRYAGPREAVFHALCRRNYGCTHFIVGRDHAGVGNYYGSFEAHEIFGEFTPAELGITPILLDHPFWCRICAQMATAKTCPHAPEERVALSATEVRRRLASGEPIPHEFSRPQVIEVLREQMSSQGSAG